MSLKAATARQHQIGRTDIGATHSGGESNETTAGLFPRENLDARILDSTYQRDVDFDTVHREEDSQLQ